MCEIVACKKCDLTFRACDGYYDELFMPCELHQALNKRRMQEWAKNKYRKPKNNDWIQEIVDSFNANRHKKIITS